MVLVFYMSDLRGMMRFLRNTPFHPQWLSVGRADVRNWIIGEARGYVLDVGCADQWVAKHLPSGCTYLGIDNLDSGEALYGARPSLFADAGHLPFADESIDTIVMLEVLEHVRDPQQVMREMARVLRPQGRALITMPFLYPVHDAPYDFQRYTIYGHAREAALAGLTVQEIKPRLGSAETAGLLASIVLGGAVYEAIRNRHPMLVFSPFMLALIPLINVIFWLAGRLFPSWENATMGYRIALSK